MRRPSTASDYFGKKKTKLSPKRPTDKTPRGGKNYVSSRKFTPRGGRQKVSKRRFGGLPLRRPATSSVIRKQNMASPVVVRNSNDKKNLRGTQSPRCANSPFRRSVRASQKIYKNSSIKQRRKYMQLKQNKIRKYEKYNHHGFVYYSSKNLLD